jgi:hypothetical protein
MRALNVLPQKLSHCEPLQQNELWLWEAFLEFLDKPAYCQQRWW